MMPRTEEEKKRHLEIFDKIIRLKELETKARNERYALEREVGL